MDAISKNQALTNEGRSAAMENLLVEEGLRVGVISEIIARAP